MNYIDDPTVSKEVTHKAPRHNQYPNIDALAVAIEVPRDDCLIENR